MSEKLTDAQVAALRGAWINPVGEVEGDVSVLDAEYGSHYLSSLALEVHQSRQRRCGNCGWWEDASPRLGRCRGGSTTNPVAESWSCADFTPKEPA